MPTVEWTFSGAEEVKMKWKEPYVTEGLNRKAMLNPQGIYRGFVLNTDPGAGERTIEVSADPVFSDHLAALLDTSGDYSLTIRKTGGAFLLDLSSYTSEFVMVVLQAAYSVGSDTEVVIKTYTEPELGLLPSAYIGLGTVNVPASGAVAADSINRSLGGLAQAWTSRSPGACEWYPVIKNPEFDGGLAHWRAHAGSNTVEVSTGDFFTGTKSIRFVGVSGSSLFTAEVAIPVFFEGQRVSVRFSSKIATALGVGDDAGVAILWKDAENGFVRFDRISIDPAIVGSWVGSHGEFSAPSGAAYFRIAFFHEVVTPGGIWFGDSIQAYVERVLADFNTKSKPEMAYAQAVRATEISLPANILHAIPLFPTSDEMKLNATGLWFDGVSALFDVAENIFVRMFGGLDVSYNAPVPAITGSNTQAAVTGDPTGVHGESLHGIGVHGVGAAQVGVLGESTSAPGVKGESSSGYGVIGVSTSNYGLRGESGVVGVSGTSFGRDQSSIAIRIQHSKAHSYSTGGTPHWEFRSVNGAAPSIEPLWTNLLGASSFLSYQFEIPFGSRPIQAYVDGFQAGAGGLVWRVRKWTHTANPPISGPGVGTGAATVLDIASATTAFGLGNRGVSALVFTPGPIYNADYTVNNIDWMEIHITGATASDVVYGVYVKLNYRAVEWYDGPDAI